MRIRLVAAAVAGVALLALVACGSDDAPAAPAGTPRPAATTAPAPTATPVPTIAPTVEVEVESLSVADRAIAGLPESPVEQAAATDGSPEAAVVARFNAEVAVSEALEGAERVLAQQQFCSPDQRLKPGEITPDLVAKRDAAFRSLMSSGGHTPEGFSRGSASALITIPGEALVLYSTYEFGEKKHDLGDEWLEIEGQWYHKSCN